MDTFPSFHRETHLCLIYYGAMSSGSHHILYFNEGLVAEPPMQSLTAGILRKIQ